MSVPGRAVSLQTVSVAKFVLGAFSFIKLPAASDRQKFEYESIFLIGGNCVDLADYSVVLAAGTRSKMAQQNK